MNLSLSNTILTTFINSFATALPSFTSFLEIMITIAQYSNPVFTGLWGLIIVSLVWTAATGLLYLVVNLSVLSLLVIFLWICITEVTIIFVVYILAFVGAVIMLFLSVVMMLPSSVFTPKPLLLMFAVLPSSIDFALQPSTLYFVLIAIFNIVLLVFLTGRISESILDSISAQLQQQYQSNTFSIIRILWCTGLTVILRIKKLINTMVDSFLKVRYAMIDCTVGGLHRYAETAAQNSAKFSLFFTACPPYATSNEIRYDESVSAVMHLDSLAAIKGVLYLDSPLLLLVSVIGLLIALIGSAVLSRSNLSSAKVTSDLTLNG